MFRPVMGLNFPKPLGIEVEARPVVLSFLLVNCNPYFGFQSSVTLRLTLSLQQLETWESAQFSFIPLTLHSGQR
jgi:hypothetical protein